MPDESAPADAPVPADMPAEASADMEETSPEATPDRRAALLDPTSAEVNMEAPATFEVRFETSKGTFFVEAHREWSPNGVDRFYNLVRNGFYDDVRFFRVIANFMAQFGMHGDPEIQGRWGDANIPDDPVLMSNVRGRVTFAMGGPNTRSTQLFISYIDNSRLDPDGFSPIGEVTQGMEVVDALYSGYGESAARGGAGPIQGEITAGGNEYLRAGFPNLDYVERAVIVGDERSPDEE